VSGEEVIRELHECIARLEAKHVAPCHQSIFTPAEHGG
jgi:hypothetical protein